MNNKQRADSWVKGALYLRGKPLLIAETRKGFYLGVVDRNHGGAELILANSASKVVKSVKEYDKSARPIKVLKAEIKNRGLRIVVRTD